ncbi:hypothetical protein B0H34DRAFT_67149 [Crassisporium funariophilum]|nr:hypothetical protein B0H34DRAFT_67149 [Crassisporium funariophilum]
MLFASDYKPVSRQTQVSHNLCDLSPIAVLAMTSIILSNPQNLDLRTLGDITRQSLALLKPWTLLGNSTDNLVVQRVSAEAAQYVDAIKLGVSAAYSGFTVTEEVIFLAECLPCNDSADLQRYLVGMLELAKTARENANKAFDAFRSVRQQIALVRSLHRVSKANSCHFF